MKIGVVSDLHLEGGIRFVYNTEPMDVLVFPGDIHSSPHESKDFFQHLRDVGFVCPFIYVLGNHEYYGRIFPSALDEYKSQASMVKDVVVLEKEVAVFGGVRFVGTTLWSDLSNPSDAIIAQQSINDFNLIYDRSYTRLQPFGYTKEWRKCKKWLSSVLSSTFEGPTVVVTHHVPLFELVPCEFIGDRLNPVFSSDMSDLILDFKPELWVYGHNHSSGDRVLDIAPTRFVSNQAGYLKSYGSTACKIEVIEI